MEIRKLQFAEMQWSYRKWGEGRELLLALHGFSDTGEIFEPLSTQLPSGLVLVALDLPYHGDTRCTLPEYRPEHLLEVIHALLQQEDAARLHLLGFSYGGRLAMHLAIRLQPLLGKLILLAPDGIATRGAWATELPYKLQQQLFQLGRRRAGRIIQIADLLHRVRLLDNFSFRFVRHHLRDPGKRERLLRTSSTTRNFPVHLRYLRRLEKEQVHFFLGSKDRIVPATLVEQQLRRQLPDVRVHRIHSDHLLPQQDKVLTAIARILTTVD